MERLGLTIAESAEATTLSRETIKKAVRSGELAAVHIGRRVVIRPAALDAWLASNETDGAA